MLVLIDSMPSRRSIDSRTIPAQWSEPMPGTISVTERWFDESLVVSVMTASLFSDGAGFSDNRFDDGSHGPIHDRSRW
jgi:hypothetical protein